MSKENLSNNMKKIFLISLLFISCNTDSKISSNELLSFENKVISNGDALSYSKLIRHYDGRADYYKLMPYSIEMAINYRNADAYYQIYRDLIRIKNKGNYHERLIENLDANSRNFAIGCLVQGAKLNDMDCQDALIQHYKNGWGVIYNQAKIDSIVSSFK